MLKSVEDLHQKLISNNYQKRVILQLGWHYASLRLFKNVLKPILFQQNAPKSQQIRVTFFEQTCIQLIRFVSGLFFISVAYLGWIFGIIKRGESKRHFLTCRGFLVIAFLGLQSALSNEISVVCRELTGWIAHEPLAYRYLIPYTYALLCLDLDAVDVLWHDLP